MEYLYLHLKKTYERESRQLVIRCERLQPLKSHDLMLVMWQNEKIMSPLS